MKKALEYCMLLWLALFVFTACQPKNDDVEEATLSINKSALAFTKAGGTETIDVETNQENWSAFSTNRDWIKITKKDRSIEITVEENAKEETRVGSVVVLAGGRSAEIEINQSQAEVVLSIEMSSAEIKMPSEGATKFVAVSGNPEGWRVEVLEKAKEWITVTKSGALIMIEAKNNQDYKEREATIVVKDAKGTEYPVTVKQVGITKYLLPFITKSFNLNDLVRFETGRGSAVRSMLDPESDGTNEFPGEYKFVTSTKYMPIMEYSIATYMDVKYDFAFTTLMFYSKAKTDVPEELTEYTKMLEDNGYVKSKESTQNSLIYENEAQLMRAQIEIASNEGAQIRFTNIIRQPKDYPTFKRFPYGDKGVFDLLPAKKSKAEVMAFEQTMKSTHLASHDMPNMADPSETMFQTFLTNKSGEDEVQRGYFYYTTYGMGTTPENLQTVQQLQLYYEEPTLGAWAEGSKRYVTKEFEAMIKKEGFEYLQYYNKSHLYTKRYDSARILYLFVTTQRYSQVLNGDPVLCISYSLIDAPESASSQAQKNIRFARKGKYEKIQTLPQSVIKRVNELNRMAKK